MLWLAQHPETTVEPVEFLATPQGSTMMPAELHYIVDQLLTHQFVQANDWHEATPAAVTLTQRGRHFAQYLATTHTGSGGSAE